jgi:DNA-binding winged helix-turn-helix (wHTH) protein
LNIEMSSTPHDIVVVGGFLSRNDACVPVCLLSHFRLVSSPFFFWLLLLIIPVGLVGFYVKNRFRKKVEEAPVSDNSDYITLGKFRFYTANNVLKAGHTTISLSEKETKALKIFAENINQIGEREKLMKEIWEDQGIVVISRNVDVLVSKLRKKLSDDNSFKFINVHGRGYKFIIE